MGRRRTPHLNSARNRRVWVVMRDGESFLARFKQRTGDSRRVEFFDHPTVLAKLIRVMSDYIPNGGSSGHREKEPA